MRLKLAHIIDLEYLIGLDEELDSADETGQLRRRDREIYKQIHDKTTGKEALFLKWLEIRREQLEKDGGVSLPGALFLQMSNIITWCFGLSGLLTGFFLVWAFLSYRGSTPVNVTLFIFLFILLQFAFAVTAIIFLLFRVWRSSRNRSLKSFSGLIYTAVQAIVMKGFPRLIRRFGSDALQQKIQTLETTGLVILLKSKQYQSLFEMPVYCLAALFSFCLSSGILAGTLFKVMVTDLAFGWQSTILKSEAVVHRLVSVLAWPWAGWFPFSDPHPSLEQIEGSRIVLKDGISVLATQDLVSWWPFLCMGLVVYALIPRGISLAAGWVCHSRRLKRFDFNTVSFNTLHARMTTPVLSVSEADAGTGMPVHENPVKSMTDLPEDDADIQGAGQAAVVCLPFQIFSPEDVEKIKHKFEGRFGHHIETVVDIRSNASTDTDGVLEAVEKKADLAVFIQEVWQPPIRGILHYFKQMRTVIPGRIPIMILLVRDAGNKDLCVPGDDPDFKIWKKAVYTLEEPTIQVVRLS